MVTAEPKPWKASARRRKLDRKAASLGLEIQPAGGQEARPGAVGYFLVVNRRHVLVSDMMRGLSAVQLWLEGYEFGRKAAHMER